jgi:homoserine acetyltransferase
MTLPLFDIFDSVKQQVLVQEHIGVSRTEISITVSLECLRPFHLLERTREQ